MTHTPGPWFSPDGKTIKQDYRQIGLSDSAGCMIGAVMGGSTSGPAFIEINEEVSANTKLICAAPELLEALEALLDRVQLDGDSRNWFAKEQHDSMAAITKARGNNQ